MADSEPVTKIAAQESLTNTRTLINLLIDGRMRANRTDVTALTYAVASDGSDQIIYADGTANVVSIELPASADVPGLSVIVYVKDSTNAVTVTRDGTDTINQAASNPTPTAGTGRVLFSLGDGDWLMWAIP